MDREWLEKLLKKELKHNGTSIYRIVNIEHEPAVAKGENFASVILRYRIVLELDTGERIVKNIIVKTVPNCAQQAAFCTETPVFKNEIFVYAVVTKAMEALMKEFNDKREKLWCELIGYRNYDRLILEDLTVKNFDVMNRREMLDYDHSLLAVQSLARYHAMSAVLLKRNIIKPDDFGQLLFVSNKEMIDLFFTSFFSTMAEIVKVNWGTEWYLLSEHLHKASKTALDRYRNMVRFKESRFNVINHGDCWTNNLMFKHENGTNRPAAIRFIDYQMGHCNSFAWDLTYFLYNSTWPETRRTSYSDILAAYHKSLSECLSMYSYPAEDIPTLDYVFKEMERLKFFGFGVLTSIHAFTSAETADSYDLFLSYENKQNPAVGINKAIFTCKKYRKKIEDDMRAFLEQGVI